MSEKQDQLEKIYREKYETLVEVKTYPRIARRFYKLLNGIFQDENEHVEPWLLNNFSDVVEVVHDAWRDNLLKPKEDKIEDFVISGFDFMARNQDSGLSWRAWELADAGRTNHYHSGLVYSMRNVYPSDRTNEKAHDYVFETIDTWYNPSLKIHNEEMIAVALDLGRQAPNIKDEFQTNKYVLKQDGDQCALTDLQNHKKIVYRWDDKMKEIVSAKTYDV